MSAAVIAQLAEVGAGQVAVVAGKVLACLAVPVAVFLGLLWSAGKRHPLGDPEPGCPCCTAEPYTVNDCTCPEDCGVTWCQAADERPECPWCDTHACIDRTLCNCRTACGSWLCEAKEESR